MLRKVAASREESKYLDSATNARNDGEKGQGGMIT
jgi:hypothetical protein